MKQFIFLFIGALFILNNTVAQTTTPDKYLPNPFKWEKKMGGVVSLNQCKQQ